MKTDIWTITAKSRLTGQRHPIAPEMARETAEKVFREKFPNGKTRRGAAWVKPKIERIQLRQLELKFEE